jgi:glycosyltransferase involved in cell wall biosynthesis
LPFHQQNSTADLRVAVIADFAEERWPSMDLVAEMLEWHLRDDYASSIQATVVRPRFVRVFGRMASSRKSTAAFNADRILNRFIHYPLWLRANRHRFDLFHVLDHSYSHLVHHLPADRTVVSCHDLDTFRCVLEPSKEHRSKPFRVMTNHILRGLQHASKVICPSAVTRDALIRHRIVSADRIRVISYGVHPALVAEDGATGRDEIELKLGPRNPDVLEILHVGSTIPRKRIDVLLDVFAAVRKEFKECRLIRAGAEFTQAQQMQAERLGIGDSITSLPILNKEPLAELYRRATVVLMTSKAEGFGLPIIEAMACGAPVVVSDIPVFREVAADRAPRCAVGDVEAWAGTVVGILREKRERPSLWTERSMAGRLHASRFTWKRCTDETVETYRAVASAARAGQSRVETVEESLGR